MKKFHENILFTVGIFGFALVLIYLIFGYEIFESFMSLNVIVFLGVVPFLIGYIIIVFIFCICFEGGPDEIKAFILMLFVLFGGMPFFGSVILNDEFIKLFWVSLIFIPMGITYLIGFVYIFEN